jgi:hypothetical protein
MINWLHFRQQYLELFFLTINGQNFTQKSKVLFPYRVKKAEVLINQKFTFLIDEYTKIKLTNYPIINNNFKIPLIDVIGILLLIRKKIYTENNQKILRSETVEVKQLTDTRVINNKDVFQLSRFFKRNLKKYIYSSLVQGSVATEDYTRFSDFDTFIILKKNVLLDKNDFLSFMIKNIKSSKFLYRFDPYQHHRNWICHEEDLKYYDQSILPIEVIIHGRIILGNNKIKFNLINSNESILYHANIGLISLQSKIETGYCLKNMWHLKDFISTLLLFPVILLELKNNYVYKRESFELARKEFSFSDLEWKAIEIATELRSVWTINFNFKHQSARLLLLYLNNNTLLYQSIAKKYGELIPEFILKIINERKFIHQVELFIKKSSLVIKEHT